MKIINFSPSKETIDFFNKYDLLDDEGKRNAFGVVVGLLLGQGTYNLHEIRVYNLLTEESWQHLNKQVEKWLSNQSIENKKHIRLTKGWNYENKK